MYILIIQISCTVFLWTCTNITISIKISFDYSIHACYKWKTSYIEFSALVEKRVVNVLLKNHCPVAWAVRVHIPSNFLNFLLYFYTISSIWVFSWFYNPDVFSILSLAALTDLLLTIVVIFKSYVFRIIWTVFNMESQRQSIEYVFFFATVSIIVSHVKK